MAGMQQQWLDEGFARLPAPGVAARTFEIAQMLVVIVDDRAAAFKPELPFLALYMGGLAEETNFHADVYRRMGYTRGFTGHRLFPVCQRSRLPDHPDEARRRRRDRR